MEILKLHSNPHTFRDGCCAKPDDLCQRLSISLRLWQHKVILLETLQNFPNQA